MKGFLTTVAAVMAFGGASAGACNPDEAIVDIGKALAEAWSQSDYPATGIQYNGFVLNLGTSYHNGYYHSDAHDAGLARHTVTSMPNASLPGFQYNGHQWSFVVANTTGVELTEGMITVPGESVRPGELLVHPCSDSHHFYISCVAPTSGCYRVVMEVRDLDGAGGGNAYGWGVEASIRKTSNFNVLAYKICSAETIDDVPSAIAIDLPCIELEAGESIAFAIGNNGDYGYDLTAVRAYLFAAEPPKGNEVINIDVDGEAPGDAGEGHIWATSDESACFAQAGSFWNSLHVYGSVASFGTNALCYANGKKSKVGIAFAAKSGSGNINFDCYPGERTNNRFPKLSGDYFYMFQGDDCDITITGLRPGKCYDLVFYGRNGDGWRVKFNGFEATAASDGDQFFMRDNRDLAVDGRAIMISDVPADENGEIRGATYTTSGAPVVFYGMQIRGSFAIPGFVAIVR